MILLHHPIAFPPKGWNEYVALPKDCSAQTCELAAVETSNIVGKFLAHTPIPFVNVQFAFCAFVAAKALLFDHQIMKRPLRPEFSRLIRDLWDMSDRWKGKNSDECTISSSSINQPGIYAQHLERLHDACQRDSQFKFDFYDHSCKFTGAEQYISPVSTATPTIHSTTFVRDRAFAQPHARKSSVNSSQPAVSPRTQLASANISYGATAASPAMMLHNTGFQPPPSLFSPSSIPPQYATGHNGFEGQNHQGYQVTVSSAPTPVPPVAQLHSLGGTQTQSVQDQSLLTLSDTFMDSQFLDMDRVITFEDANFFMPGDFRWQ